MTGWQDFPQGPQHDQGHRLEKIILQNMVHGPCGKLNPSCPCMVYGKFSKGYPKNFASKTIVKQDSTYPEYKRLNSRQGGRSVIVKIKSKEYLIDNTWIVPYSPFLSLRYNCHINVEVCMSPMAAKYLFKYVTKGVDRAMVRTEIVEDTEKVEEEKNEIKEYIDMRSIGSSEACWHIFNMNVAKNTPAVFVMRVHMEEEQHIVFDIGNEQQVLEKQRCTELTAFFEYNLQNANTQITYVDFPEKFTWINDKKQWKPRKSNFDTIGRVHTVNPVALDVYYLRMLLHHEHCAGCTSFQELRTVDGEAKDSYQEVCRALGLLQDDQNGMRL